MKSRTFALVLVLLVGLIGCGDDDNGGTAPPTTGTVVINPQPEGIDAPWEITGPDDYAASGSGQAELTDRTPGEYEVTWSDVDEFITPVSTPQTLAAGETITFTGIYADDRFVYIEPGTFMMGSPEDEPGREMYTSGETQRQVTLTRGFYMSKHEVTERWWHDVMGGVPSNPQLRLPKSVTWDQAVQFCNALSAQEGLTPAYTIHSANGNVTWNQTANGYRLPTEAEWEYACRSGTTLAFNNNTNCLLAGTEANFVGWLLHDPYSPWPPVDCPEGTSFGGPTEVGIFPANQWGLFDMHGNMWEWVWDGLRFDPENLDPVDPVHHAGVGESRVKRDGRWESNGRECRSAARSAAMPAEFYDGRGLRPVRTFF